eukprot:410173-Rhodomonas_salina.3
MAVPGVREGLCRALLGSTDSGEAFQVSQRACAAVWHVIGHVHCDKKPCTKIESEGMLVVALGIDIALASMQSGPGGKGVCARLSDRLKSSFDREPERDVRLSTAATPVSGTDRAYGGCYKGGAHVGDGGSGGSGGGRDGGEPRGRAADPYQYCRNRTSFAVRLQTQYAMRGTEPGYGRLRHELARAMRAHDEDAGMLFPYYSPMRSPVLTSANLLGDRRY